MTSATRRRHARPSADHGARAGQSGGGRLAALDGLRGLAALIVVVHHAALTLPALADQYRAPNPGSRTFLLAYTPLHLLWAGGEAVLVFFVLSGLVLTRPMLTRSGRATWLSYYPKRVARLYLPVLVAVLVTGAVLTVVPRVAVPGRSWWFNAHAMTPDLRDLLHDAFLLDGTGWANSALWSLQYEVLFSLFLPVFVVIVRGLSVPLWISAPFALWGIGWAASISHETLSYMFVFAAGALIAGRLDEVGRWVAPLTAGAAARSRRSAVLWAVLGAGALLLLLSEWWMKLFVSNWRLWLPYGRPAAVLGAGLLILMVVHCQPVRRVFEHRLLQWLGTISFSLYLIHEPLVVSVAAVWAPSPHRLPVTVAVSVAISLAAAVAFFRLVERPSHRLANVVGVAATRKAAALPGRRQLHVVSGLHGTPRHQAARHHAAGHDADLHDTVALRPVLPSPAAAAHGVEPRPAVGGWFVRASSGGW